MLWILSGAHGCWSLMPSTFWSLHSFDTCITIYFVTVDFFRSYLLFIRHWPCATSLYPFNSCSLHRFLDFQRQRFFRLLLLFLRILVLPSRIPSHVLTPPHLIPLSPTRLPRFQPFDISKVPFFADFILILVFFVIIPTALWHRWDGYYCMGMHGLIPEEPRPSTSRSIARFADSDSIFGCCIFCTCI